jgi:hypothetical protein
MYGMRDAAYCWVKAVRTCCDSHGSVIGKCSHCVWYARDLFGLEGRRVMCHLTSPIFCEDAGDDVDAVNLGGTYANKRRKPKKTHVTSKPSPYAE